jgi:hypothetical protein
MEYDGICGSRGSFLWGFIVTPIDDYRWVIEGVPIAQNSDFIRIVAV